jgi:hypothetical protein
MKKHNEKKVALSVVVFCLALAALGSPAGAKALDVVTCLGAHSAEWSPGVTNTEQQHTVVTDTNWDCTRLLNPLWSTSATFHEEFQAEFSCSSLLDAVPVTWTVQWEDGATSTFQFTASVNSVAGNLVILAPGTITAGRYAGSNATATFTLLNLASTLELACASPEGVTGASGPSVFAIFI